MIFELVLKYIFKAETEEERLKSSVIYGWTLAILGIFSSIIVGSFADVIQEDLGVIFLWTSLITFALFIIRYTSVKPLLGAAAGGISVIAIGAILDSLSNRKDNALSIGALFGVLLTLFIMLVKNLIVSWYYLIRETVRYYHFKKKHIQLDETVLNNTVATEM
ncbi:hypothetical protein QUF56_12140 [Ureibacillus composti]|nr:hypothetical protein [Ureibacillus composti]